MSKRRVELVLLCEDSQHEAFARRFLKGMGWEKRAIRVEKSPSSEGSGEQYVRERFPKELGAYRTRRNKAASAILAMIDADGRAVEERIGQLADQCSKQNVPFREDKDAVAIAVPRRNIETWIHCLEGNNVNEDDKYPKLGRAGLCAVAVDNLIGQCRGDGLDENSPPSFLAACEEYKRIADMPRRRAGS